MRIVLPAGVNTAITVKDDRVQSMHAGCSLNLYTGRKLNVLCYCVLQKHKLLYFDCFVYFREILQSVLHECVGIVIQFERVCFRHSVWGVIITTREFLRVCL